MDNQNHSNQDCGCIDGCCTPQKKGNLWKKILFLLIVLAAGTIITVKLVANQSASSEKCCDVPASASCCPQTGKQDAKAANCCVTPVSSSCCAPSN